MNTEYLSDDTLRMMLDDALGAIARASEDATSKEIAMHKAKGRYSASLVILREARKQLEEVQQRITEARRQSNAI